MYLNKRKIFWFIQISPLLVLLFFGGALQFVGALSQTMTNYLVMFLVGLNLLFFGGFKRINKSIKIVIFGVFIATSIYLAILVPHNFIEYAVYVYYLLFFFSIILYAISVHTDNLFENIDRFFIPFLLLQIVVCACQVVFGDILASLSSVPMQAIDMVSGTLFLGSDAILCVLVNCMVVYELIRKKSINRVITIYALGAVVIYLTNSKALQAIYLLMPFFVLGEYFYIRFNKYMVTILMAFVILLMLIVFQFNVSFIVEKINVFIDLIYEGFFSIKYGEEGSRLSVFGFVLTGQFSNFGLGLLTYYNPLSKLWLFNAGFSTFYLLLLDTGLVFTVIFYLLCSYFILLSNPKSIISYYILLVFFVFSFFGLILTTGVVLFSITTCLFVNFKKKSQEYIDE
jgi:hypothetical protein